MRRFRTTAAAVGVVVVALVLQSTLLARFRYFTPDLVMLAVILTVLGLRSEAGLILGFLSGLLHDLVVGNTVVGLRAFTYTSVAFLALRTRTRTAAGLLAISLWAGGLTLLGRVLLLVLGILFGQSAVIGGQLMRQIVLVPATNAILAGLLAVPVELAIGRRSA